MNTEPGNPIIFGAFRLDQDQGQLWQDDHVVALQPKPLAVLQYLAQRPGQVVSSKELLKSVWAGVYVTKAVVKECMRAIRGALGEDASAPQYIETVGREGYRFLAPLLTTPPVQGSTFQVQSSPSLASTVVGRETELALLRTFLGKALDGQPQLVFVTGEPGIGKTTVIDRFRAHVRATNDITIGYGQCIEQYGGGEAYHPILEALSRLCREAEGPAITATLRQYAPTWLVQLPGVLEEAEAQTLRSQVQGATQQRMLREIAEAIAAGTARRPLVLLLEDLHWSDQATVELLSYLAQRRERALLMVIGTYRPADAVLGNHPLKALKQELHAKRQCEEIRLELLSKHEVSEYLGKRFPSHQFPSELVEVIHHRTEGNALFIVNFVEELLQQGYIVEEQESWHLRGDISQVQAPETLRQLIEKQLGQLGEEEQRVLEVASVAGSEFVVSAVAAGLQQNADVVEEICEELARQGHFLQERGTGEWADGTISGKYSFGHALYQNVLYDRIAQARRIRVHRQIGDRLEEGYGEHAKEIAAELAVHFEHGRDYQRTVRYLEYAGKNAVQRSAHREAIVHLTKGLELLKTLPDTPERTQQELMFLVTLGSSLIVTKGFAAPDVEKVYARAEALCQMVGETPQLFPVLRGLIVFYLVRGDVQTAYNLKKQFLSLAQRVQDPAHLTEAHYMMGGVMFTFGEFTVAREHFEQGIAFYDPQKHRALALVYGHDPQMANLSFLAHTLWLLGYPEQGLKRMHQSLAWVQELADPYNLGGGLSHSAQHHQYRREAQATYERITASLALATEQGFALLMAQGNIWKGAALAEQGQGADAILLIRQGLDACSALHSVIWRGHHLALLAEAYGKVEQPEAGLSVLAEALEFVDSTGDRSYEAELYRLKGTLTLQQANQKSKSKNQKSKFPNSNSQRLNPNSTAEDEAEACFLKSIEVSRKQQAKSLELRAVMSLARLWQQQGKKKEAHQELATIYNWFTEGFDTKDLQEAKTLLDSLTPH